MRITIIYSGKTGKQPENIFQMKTDSRFANVKFIPHLHDDPMACNLCGKKCYWCRRRYQLNFSEYIQEMIELPDIYPLFVDEPLTYLPKEFMPSDVFVVIGVHQDILVELPGLIHRSGGKAIVVPCEGSDWVSRWTRERTIEECEKFGLEYDFPKPFCAMKQGKFETINQFMDFFRIGKPKMRLYVDEEDVIRKVDVLVSAPCGNGYNVAKHLLGVRLGETAKKSVAKYWHSFPCMGGMQIDPELGDTILHIGGYLHYSALDNAEIIRTEKTREEQ